MLFSLKKSRWVKGYPETPGIYPETPGNPSFQTLNRAQKLRATGSGVSGFGRIKAQFLFF